MNQGIIAEIKKGKNTRIKRESPTPREAYKLNEHLTNIRRCPKPWTCEFSVVRSDLMSVCVKQKVFVHNNASNNNMITKMKPNRIINVKNKVMNDI